MMALISKLISSRDCLSYADIRSQLTDFSLTGFRLSRLLSALAILSFDASSDLPSLFLQILQARLCYIHAAADPVQVSRISFIPSSSHR